MLSPSTGRSGCGAPSRSIGPIPPTSIAPCDRGCVGISVPAGALSSLDALARAARRCSRAWRLHGAPLLVHPGPGAPRVNGRQPDVGETSLGDPLWWTPLTSYVACMHAAWLAFRAAGRSQHPDLRVIFSMLAALAPLHAERLCSRGGPGAGAPDPLVFYDTSSYGPSTVRTLEEAVGREQLLYGSDRPVVEPGELGMPWGLDWDSAADATRRALGAVRPLALLMSSTSSSSLRERARRRSCARGTGGRAGSRSPTARSRSLRARAAVVRRPARRQARAVDRSRQARLKPTRLRGASQRGSSHRLADLLDG